MVARTDDKPFAAQAQVDPQKCIGCGICAGSCDSAGVGLAWFDTIEQRHRIDALVEKALAENREALLALVCNESAGNALELDELTGRCHELPNWVIVKVPCAGWIHPLTVERAVRRKARGVLIVASGRGSCMYREGNRWTVDRMSGARAPSLRDHKVDVQRVRVTELFRTERRKLLEEAKAFERDLPAATTSPKRPRRLSAGLVLAAAFSVLVWGATKIGYAAPRDSSPTLVVSFKHPGQAAENCREPSAAELEKLPRHMRAKKICERRRSNVRLRVHVDGQLVLEKSYEPRGIWHDGNSIAIERIAVPAGTHDVKVELGDTPEVSEMNHAASRPVTLRQRRNVVVLFDKMSGFQWFE